MAHSENLGGTVETLTSQIECWDSLGSRVQSQSMSKPYKCCSMLCEVFFSLWLITRHTKSQTDLKLGEVSLRRSYPYEGF